ncbi:transcription antitermination factor NusB [Arthrobacter sp. AL08]|uniref:RsmB/NOP family class I SAM-dependent RNA methyltransferase n=1 Tax=Micrococcaceae TaxID=1268 RepID=UPI001CFFA190|nr:MULTISPECIES: transcription antitermination factor NusB [Micrococcaceae]MCB5280869.1 putative methyltransferase [Arthrobacter sp. ES1]MDI3241573.1 transcription antitermination factor NusB [Arthrobacter sp. AL05]MDI3277583.1 transcription antitermination factor NusB [Arthrobacter sp. AL08]MDJ0353535.1 transcription antitermination factor NusB [Pseudarthrobacter sp. PH31-O2]WGZ80647.1 transcription antitermination factor NusB [Arthrobacter sp. EM1]
MSESGTSGRGNGPQRGGSGGQRGAGQSGGQGGRGRDGSHRNAQGRERNRGPQRGFTENAPSQRTRRADPARLVAFEVLRAVAAEDAYANLVLPARIRHHGLDKRDAGFATELSYGALRGQGTYDAILARCVDRPLDQLDPAILDALRIGAHQLLAMRVPAHAALDQTVGLARAVIGAGPSTLINAVLRKVSARNFEEWLELLLSDETDETKKAAIRYAHPEWIVRALRQSLVAHGRPVSEIGDLLEADNAAPVVNLVALPGLGSLDEALEGGATPGELVEGSALSSGGDLGRLASVREGTTRVQDVGSQLVARALAAVDLGGSTTRTGEGGTGDSTAGSESPAERWLDMCAGPGGKAALLGALAREHGATLLANEPAAHRAKLVRQALAAVPHEVWHVRTGDGREVGTEMPESFDRVLVDAPCTGLGALRRRPESRWRRTPKDLTDLGPLQRELLKSAVDAVKPGGVVAYVTCSPHPAETTAVVSDVLRKRDDLELLDAGAVLDSVSLTGHLDAGHELTAQLWPHVHRTDAMFLALIHKLA